jgi:uncharacterized cupin superfamily protein
MPKIDIAGIKVESGSNYPEPFHNVALGRHRKRLGNAVGLNQFGVNLTTLKPGSQSSQRHWHANEDELVYVLEGEVVLRENGGETVLRPGDAAGWKAGVADGHCLINRSQRDAVFLEIGSRHPHERAEYSEIDMIYVRDDNGFRYQKKSGELYPKK